MISSLTHVSLPVLDYDEALGWYTEKLGLEIRDNVEMNEYGSGYRWLTVGVPGHKDLEIILHKSSLEQADTASKPASKMPYFIFSTDDCQAEVKRLRANGVEITGEPEEVPWGVQAMFEDLYGNTHVLVEPPNH
jgi:predicted enzyme related to lactoylglutathione lyase